MEIKIQNGYIIYNGANLGEAPTGQMSIGSIWRPQEKKVWLEKINKWVVIWFFHDGSPMDITLV